MTLKHLENSLKYNILNTIDSNSSSFIFTYK